MDPSEEDEVSLKENSKTDYVNLEIIEEYKKRSLFFVGLIVLVLIMESIFYAQFLEKQETFTGTESYLTNLAVLEKSFVSCYSLGLQFDRYP